MVELGLGWESGRMKRHKLVFFFLLIFLIIFRLYFILSCLNKTKKKLPRRDGVMGGWIKRVSMKIYPFLSNSLLTSAHTFLNVK